MRVVKSIHVQVDELHTSEEGAGNVNSRVRTYLLFLRAYILSVPFSNKIIYNMSCYF